MGNGGKFVTGDLQGLLEEGVVVIITVIFNNLLII
jgi:hypothetical protein